MRNFSRLFIIIIISCSIFFKFFVLYLSVSISQSLGERKIEEKNEKTTQQR